MKFRVDGFVLAIMITIVIAYFLPQIDQTLPLSAISQIGVSFIFFFYGLKLSPDKLKAGLKNWKLHVLVQTSTFVIFPLLLLLLYPLSQNKEQPTLWLAFMFLAALPSTVSSSVVMVSMAKGNVPAAIFNASISGLLGIVITPLWMRSFIPSSTHVFDLWSVYGDLVTQILVPVVIGIFLHRYLGHYAQQYSKQLSFFDKSIILLIIYKSFSASFEGQVFNTISVVDIVLIAGGATILFFSVYFLTGYLGKLFNFNEADKITLQFCGTKKSLVHGTVFSKILFQNSAAIGIILLPIMLFHAIQILIVSIIAGRLATRTKD
ncbi:MAG: bile acid:sodium symporter [Cyclobacteriaceae bacterium]|nr:bile acid:sodium symporter [Cyclobacteriaceae bacterium]